MARTAPFTLALAAFLACAVSAAPVRADDPPSTGSPATLKPVDLQNTKCPVTGKPVVAGITDTVNGTVVHFCCRNCVAKYHANPAAYQSALRSEPAVALRLDEANGANGGANGVKDADVPKVVPTSMEMPSDKSIAFHDGMRALWIDHVVWTRQFVVSAVAGLPDKDAATARLLKNQDDIGAGIAPYYGADAGTKLTALLKDHITTAADLVGALKANDTAKADAAKAKWTANADEISAFLSAANPTAWPLEDMKSMMREHLDATTEEVAARLKSDWDGDIAAYAKVQEQALKMADMLSDGIRRQFPAKFR